MIENSIGPPIKPKIKVKGSSIRHNTSENKPQSQSLAKLKAKGIEAIAPKIIPNTTPTAKNRKDNTIIIGISNKKQKI